MNPREKMGITGALSLTSPAAKSLEEAGIIEYPELEWTPKDLQSPAVCHTVSKLCLNPAQNSLCPSVKPK